MFRKYAFAVTTLLIASGTIAQAQGKSGKGKGAGGQAHETSQTNVSVAVVFRTDDRPAYRNYFVTHHIVPSPLPPGIAKNVMRGKPLPPGIAKKAFPRELVVLTPGRRSDVTLIIVGDRLVALRSGVVIDVMLNVFP